MTFSNQNIQVMSNNIPVRFYFDPNTLNKSQGSSVQNYEIDLALNEIIYYPLAWMVKNIG